MKNDIFELYIYAVENAALVIAAIIVLLTSPVWAFVYLTYNTGKIIDAVNGRMERRRDNEQ